MDTILDQLNVFWANTEVVLDLLTKKGQHVEQFLGFASKPRLLARFQERMEEYKQFWTGIVVMCGNYIHTMQAVNQDSRSRLYSFLDNNNNNNNTSVGVNGNSTTNNGTVEEMMSTKDDSFDSINNSFFGGPGDHSLDISV